MTSHASRLASSSALTHLQKALASSLTARAAGIAHENKANHTGRNRCPEVGSCRLSLISQISDLTCPDSLPPLPVSPSLARPALTGGAQFALETTSAPLMVALNNHPHCCPASRGSSRITRADSESDAHDVRPERSYRCFRDGLIIDSLSSSARCVGKRFPRQGT
ncbi:hypothetical protein EV714DRAFT_248876 [Schizophyllum commune]